MQSRALAKRKRAKRPSKTARPKPSSCHPSKSRTTTSAAETSVKSSRSETRTTRSTKEAKSHWKAITRKRRVSPKWTLGRADKAASLELAEGASISLTTSLKWQRKTEANLATKARFLWSSSLKTLQKSGVKAQTKCIWVTCPLYTCREVKMASSTSTSTTGPRLVLCLTRIKTKTVSLTLQLLTE